MVETVDKPVSTALDGVGGTSPWTNEDRRLAAMLYLTKGSYKAVERATGIPDSTLGLWSKTEWWAELTTECKGIVEGEIRSGYLAVVKAGTKQALEAMDKANTSQAMTASAIAFDKIRLLDNQPTSIGIKVDSGGVLSKLEELSDRLNQREASVVSDIPAKQES